MRLARVPGCPAPGLVLGGHKARTLQRVPLPGGPRGAAPGHPGLEVPRVCPWARSPWDHCAAVTKEKGLTSANTRVQLQGVTLREMSRTRSSGER